METPPCSGLTRASTPRRLHRHRPLAALLGLALLAPVTARAQVTVNPGALDLLPSKPAPAVRAPTRPAPARPHPPTAAAPAAPAATKPATPTGASATKPTLPAVPPAIAALPPPAPVPPPRPQPAPVVSVAADAPGAAAPEPGGLRITFGKDRQDLNPSTEAALRALAQQLKPNDTATINIYAYATGLPDDPSTPRRLALGRALAARAVLINEGIPSTRIYPRALGPTGGETDPDRVDVLAGPPGPPSSASPPAQPSPPLRPAPQAAR